MPSSRAFMPATNEHIEEGISDERAACRRDALARNVTYRAISS